MIAQPTAPVPQRVLILKPSALGDVVTAVPVLRGLRRSFPQVRISWVLATHCVDLMAHDTDLDEVILFDRAHLGKAWCKGGAARDLLRFLRRLRRGRFDWVLDLQGLFRSGFFARATGAPVRAGFADAREGAGLFYTHRIEVAAPHTVDRNLELARQLGIDVRAEDMALQLAPRGRHFVDELREEAGLQSRGFLVCVPPTRWATKQYPVRHWRTVVSVLSKRLPVVVLGAPGDRSLCAAVAEGADGLVLNLAGRTGVAEMVAVIASSAGVIGSDSAAKFIAAACDVDSLTLIGPTQVSRTGPYRKGRTIVADVPCQGCMKRRCRHVTCMQMIGPADVIAEAQAMLDRRGG